MHVFRALLGEAYDDLPKAVRDFHDGTHAHWQGQALSAGADNPLARLLRWAFGFPNLGDQIPVDVWLSQKDGRDHWRRRFGDREFQSSFHASARGVLDERFAPFRFGFRLRVAERRMHWDFVEWRLGPLRLPLFLGPKIVTHEGVTADGTYEFYSQADFPLVGRLINYHGTIAPVADAS